AVPKIFDIETGEIEGVSDPGPPDRNEEHRETEESGWRIICTDAGGQLGDRRHKDQVVEELQPGGVSFYYSSFGRAQGRRFDQSLPPHRHCSSCRRQQLSRPGNTTAA